MLTLLLVMVLAHAGLVLLGGETRPACRQPGVSPGEPCKPVPMEEPGRLALSTNVSAG